MALRAPERYRALPAQHGMVLNSARYPHDGVDILQITLDWPSPLEPGPFEAAWRAVVRRNPVLRTAFHLHGEDGVIQVVDPDATLDIRWRDDPYEPFLLADRRAGFDPTRPPLLRLTVLGSHRSVLTFHHALLDGRSMRLLVHEVSAAYAAHRVGEAWSPPPRAAFAEFVRWWYASDTGAWRTFWTDHLAGVAPPQPLPGHLGAGVDGVAGPAEPRAAHAVLSAAESDRIRAATHRLGLRSSTVVTAAWALLRACYGGVCDIVLAVTRSCRHGSIPDADGVMGLLINTVPLRVRVDPHGSVRDLLSAVDAGIRDIGEHQRAPLADILSQSRLPAVDSLVMFERRRLLTDLPVGPHGPTGGRVDRLPSYPLSVVAYDEPRLRLGMVWDGRCLLDGAGEQMLGQLRATLLELVSEPSAPVTRLDLGAAGEANLRAAWHATTDDYPRDATVPALFAAQVARHPDAVAVESAARSMTDPPTTWTYAELDLRSTALSRALRRHGVGQDVPVAVAVPRSAELIAVLLAVLKAGGAYLPIEPGTPPARIATMLAGVPLVLVTAATAAAVPDVAGVTVLRLDDPAAGPADVMADAPDDPAAEPAPPQRGHPLGLAYVGFTSGSTGTPRAVAVPHRAVVRLVSGQTFAPLGPGERVLQLAPVAFDASTLEIWGALLTGATVVVAPPGPLGLAETAALLRTTGVTVAWLTAGLFHQLAEADPDALAAVPWLLAGGDVLDPGAVRVVLAARRGRPLVNGYGPTENTTFTACHVLTEQGQVGRTVPIGRPIRHTTVHILGPDLRPVPIGVVGDLYTGGDGLARGYRGDAAATAGAFVADPSGPPGSRMYRTGDLARWLADGTIEFIGRADDQVKIRGFRVEPGEVEAVLRTHPGVREVVVVARGDGVGRHLVGYVTRTDGADQDIVRPALLREFVARRLPEYLVPAGFVVLDRLPLNPNGKVDRAALPEHRRGRRASTAPRTDTERRLAELWRSLLPGAAGDPGREDGFFALGGNSLSAARLVFRIREAFGIDLALGAFYETPTLAALASAIDETTNETTNTATDGAAATPAGGTRTAPAPRDVTIRRSRREAYRVAPDRAAPAPHLAPLTDRWALWRTVVLRAPGFPADLLGALGDLHLATLADAVVTAQAEPDPGARERAGAAYAAEFPDAVRRLGAALHAAACLPALREAVAWQNRHALTTGLDSLVRRGPVVTGRNSRHRQHEALVASYLQRYCVKNDTIGFFGPVGWTAVDDGPGIRIQHAEPAAFLRARVTYLEGWAVRAVLAAHTEPLRPWLVPRRMPFVDVDLHPGGALLRLPLAPPEPLAPAEAAVLLACDGVRDAHAVAAEVIAGGSGGLTDPGEVFAVLARLADNHRLAWQADVPPQDIRPERSARALLSRVTDPRVRAPAEAALDELTAARDELAAAAGDPDRVAAAMAGLEATFTRLTGATATRRAGALYAGRTLAYEECLRGDTVLLGADAYDTIRAALGLVLDSARWFTATGATLYTRRFEELYRQRAAAIGGSGGGAVPFADFWLLANDDLFEHPPSLVGPAVRALQERWAAIVGLPGTPGRGERRIQLRAADLRARAAAAFPALPLPWPTAVHHSPDLMIAEADAGRFTWVLGELHPSLVTMRYATWQAFRDDPDAQHAAVRHDIGRGAVYIAETAEDGGVVARLSNVLHLSGDHKLVFAHDSCGHDPRVTLMVGECDVVDSPTGLRVRRRDGTFEGGLLEVVGDLLVAGLAHTFHLVPRGTHTPRITIDDLVIARESWTFPAAEAAFADVGDERERYLRARAWAATHGLPRHAFVRFTGERKPIYADLTSLASIDLVARSLRRSRRDVGADATVTVVEMLPTPDEAWLTDAAGRRYTSELRMVAVDQRR